MGYVIKEVKPGVFELVFVEDVAAATIKDKDEDEEEEKEKEEEKKEEEKKEEKPKVEEEPLPVADSGVLKSSALSRLVRDLKEIHEFPLPTVNAAPLENNMFEWHANVTASSDTLFCGLVFHLIMTFPENYPVKPPKVRMMNYIDHPNVFGEFICLDMLEDGMWDDPVYINKPYTGWTTAYSVQSILVQLQAFFSMDAYSENWTEVHGLKRANDSIDKFVCPCGHKKGHIWPPIAPEAIKAVQADRERILLKTGKKKPEAAAATPSSKPAPAKGKKGEEAEEKEKEKKELEPEEKKAEAKAPEKEEKSVATPQQKAPQGPPAAPKPITTKSGLTPLRRYLPGQGLVLPVPGKRAGFGDKTTLELHFQKAKLFKKFRDTEIEIKTSSDGYLYELPINEPPPRSESKDVIYFWGEVYPVDEVDVEDADPTLAARKAAGIPVVKEMTIGELMQSRPLNIPKQDTLTITLTDGGGIRPFRTRCKHVFHTVYNLEHYQNVKTSEWKLYAIDEANPKNLLVLNLKSNKFNLHFLSSVQYFAHQDRKPEAPVEQPQKKGAKGANDKGKKGPAGAQATKGAKPKPGAAKEAPAKAKDAPAKGKEQQQPKEAEAGKEKQGAAPAKGRGKAGQAKDQADEGSAKGRRDAEEEAPVKKYVPPPSAPLFISSNFGPTPAVSREQSRRDRKGKEKIDGAPGRRSEGGRGRTARARPTDPVGTGKGKDGASAAAHDGKGKEKEKEKGQETHHPVAPVHAAGPEEGHPLIGQPAVQEANGTADGHQGAEEANKEQQQPERANNNKRNRQKRGKKGGDHKGEAHDGVAAIAAAAGPHDGQPKKGDKKNKNDNNNQQGGKRLKFGLLPPEVRSHIFSFLGKKDLIRASTVSHDFEALSRGILAKSELFCYHTKLNFQEDTLGVGVTYKYYPESRNIKSISSPLDLLSHTAFHVDKVRKSVWKVRFHDWLPLYIGYRHGIKAIPLCKDSIARILTGSPVGFEPKMAITVFTKLMNTMIVDLMKCDSWASEKALEGYFAFHHWLLVFLELYPQLLDWVNETIANFIAEERYRTKRVVPALGEFIPLLALTDKYSWKDVSEAYLLENFDRNQKWVLQKYPALGNMANEKEPVDKTRIIKTQDATVVSQRLLMFHVFFLNYIAKPKGKSVADMRAMYDESFGRPSDRMKYALQQKVKELQKISNWIEFFSLIEMPLPTPRQLTYWLRGSVNNSARKRYHNRNDYVGKTRQKKKKEQAEGDEVDPYDDF